MYEDSNLGSLKRSTGTFSVNESIRPYRYLYTEHASHLVIFQVVFKLPSACKYGLIIDNILSFCMFVEYRIFTDSRLSVLLNVIYVWKERLRVEYGSSAGCKRCSFSLIFGFIERCFLSLMSKFGLIFSQ